MAFFPRGPPRGMFRGGRGGAHGPFFDQGMGPMSRGRPPRPMGPFPGRPPFGPPGMFPPGMNPGGPPPFRRFPGPAGPPHRHFSPNHRPNFPQHQHRPIRPQFGGNNKNQENKKNKKTVNKRDEENYAFYCDICDKGFQTKEVYEIHTGGHQKCKVEGCPYTAAPKLVQLHFNLQHKTGLAKKIWQFDSPEDVAKWRAERKKNYPTAVHVAKKMAERTEKVARGEVLENKFFGKFGNQNFRRGRGRGRGRGRQNFTNSRNHQFSQNPSKRSHEQSVKSHPTSPKKQKTTNSPPKKESGPTGDPLSYILPDGADGSDEDVEKQPEDNTSASEGGNPLAAGGLGSLMTAYGSDSEEEGGQNRENITTTTTTADKTADTVDKENTADSENLQPVDTQGERKGNFKRQRRKRGRKGKQSEEETSLSQKSTLLEKLLAPEIRHERNVILQCVRYIVKNKFFGLSKDTSTQESSSKGKPLSVIANADEEIWENGL